MGIAASPAGRVHDLSWRRHDLGPLVALCVVGAAVLVPAALPERARFDPAGSADPRRVTGSNRARSGSAASLRRLPNIRLVRARAIVAYRREHPSPAFRSAEDLARVRGIGPGTVEAIRDYLKLGAPPGTDAPGQR